MMHCVSFSVQVHTQESYQDLKTNLATMVVAQQLYKNALGALKVNCIGHSSQRKGTLPIASVVYSDLFVH